MLEGVIGMIKAADAIAAARALKGTSYEVIDCINLIKKIIRTAPGGVSSYTTAGTNALWDSDANSAKYRDLTWKQEGIAGAKPGMLAFMGVGTGDVNHVGLVTECGTVLHSSKSRGCVVETELTAKDGWNGLGVHRMIGVNGQVNDEDAQIDVKYPIGEYTVSYENGLRLRKRPSLTGAYMLTMPCGAKLTVTEVDGDWGKVTYKGHQGWCSLTYCNKVGEQEAAGEDEQIVIRATRQQWLAVCDGDMTIIQAALAGDD